ncbi:MAG: DUF1780 domain-containing protein [Pirellulales bacterium]|nr:DUF1780 domain-containing protein [Pirellulales bacterium]
MLRAEFEYFFVREGLERLARQCRLESKRRHGRIALRVAEQVNLSAMPQRVERAELQIFLGVGGLDVKPIGHDSQLRRFAFGSLKMLAKFLGERRRGRGVDGLLRFWPNRNLRFIGLHPGQFFQLVDDAFEEVEHGL